MAAAAAPARVRPFQQPGIGLMSPWPKPFQSKQPKVWEHWQPKPDSLETEFDRECRRLKLEGASFRRLVQSIALRHWAMRYAKKRYVPLDLLAAWGIVVNFDTEMFPW